MDVYNKKITWGEYNKGIKEISQNSLKETIRINEEINKYIEKISTENSEKISLIQKNQTEIDSQRNTNTANSNSQNNREAQCQFVRSQEYFKPVGGGFFQSMQNAESAFNNCMAGIPRITTNCTKDAFGQISCVSQ